MARTANPEADLIRQALLRWWDPAARKLPWRRRRDPYAIWVSEIMLQQTRAATVGDYFGRFLRQFPTVETLAAADLEDVLKAWEGMGYYSRARNLHLAARRVVADRGGRLPDSADELRRLPGIGPYTAAAIASIAFGRDVPVVDGNVTRVLCRVFRVRQNPKAAPTRRRLLSLARSLIAPGAAGRINQALMDLGATVCLPKRPDCERCPLAGRCLACARGEQHLLPHRAPRRRLPHYDVAAGVVWRRGRVLIDRRRPEGLLGGLWEFPGGKRRPGEPLRQTVRREIREEIGIEVTVIGPLITVRHAYTHFRITLHVFECRYKSGRCRAIGPDAWKWVRPDELDAFAFPKANHAIIAALRERKKSGPIPG